jgi:hypothetical protein
MSRFSPTGAGPVAQMLVLLVREQEALLVRADAMCLSLIQKVDVGLYGIPTTQTQDPQNERI